MSFRDSASEAEENSKQHDGFSGGGPHSNECCPPPSASSIAPPTLLALKRDTYPHWEKELLKDEVVIQLHGRSQNTCQKTEFESNGIETATESRLHAALPAALAALAPEEPNNGRDNSQLYALSPNHPSPFTSFSPPHLPLATHVPPLDPLTRFLVPKSETKYYIPTFSFSRLQIMATASTPRQSTLLCLAGLHNQVQGMPQSPSLWRPAFDVEAGVKPDSCSSNDPDCDVDGVDSLFAPEKIAENARTNSSVDGWPIMQDAQLAGLRHIELAFDDSFDACVPSMFSDNSDVRQSCRSSSGCARSSQARSMIGSGSGPGSGSECTCGHPKHFVRALQEVDHDDEASDEDAAFWSGSKRGNRLGLSGMESYTGSESSTRANASTASLFAPADSRTSSDFFLSPNFPDSDYADDYLVASASAARNYQKGDSTDDHHSGHRVYFPVQPTQAPPGSGFHLRNFFNVTRRRVSSIGGAAGRKQTHHMRRTSLSSIKGLRTGRRARKDTLPAVSDADKSRLRRGRGRSHTLRPLELNPSPCNSESSVFAEQLHNHEHEPQMSVLPTKSRGRGGKFSFMRRFSLQLGLSSGSSGETSSRGSYANEPPSFAQTFLPTGSDMRSSPPTAEEGTRTRVPSGAFLFRNFRLTSPRNPKANNRGSALDRG